MELATVEIHSVPEPLFVRSGPPEQRGARVDANGRRGFLRVEESRRNEEGCVVVETLDGLCLEVPEDCVREVEQARPEDGGFDFIWPGSFYQEQELGYAVSACLRDRGFCVVHVPEADSQREEFVAQVRVDSESFQLPAEEMEEAFLGSGAASKVSWLVGGFGAHKAHPKASTWSEIFVGGGRHVAALARELVALPGGVDFEPWSRGGMVLVRVPLAAGERERLGATSLEAQDVGEHLDFLQRRKLCMMHVLESSGGIVKLHHLLTEMKVRIPVARGRMVIFRHDVMAYSYMPQSGATAADDIALHAWILEEPPLMRLDSLEADQSRADAAMDTVEGFPLPRPESRKVNIMTVAGHYPGSGQSVWGAWASWSVGTDGVTPHPKDRWDYTLYWSPDGGQFNKEGKSSTRHGGFLDLEDIAGFDNRFFGIPDTRVKMMSPAIRMYFECSFEAFHNVGYTLQSLKGAKIALTSADGGTEWDQWAGFVPVPDSVIPYDPSTWATQTCVHGALAGMQVMHNFGLVGPHSHCDTACSASLVGANLNWAAMRQFNPELPNEYLIVAATAMLSPFTFIGVSAAGMLGSGGRNFSFDSSANGFQRGEGSGALIHKVSDDPEDSENKLGNQASGFINQDGRSASLTAPNGPSQQACIRGCLSLENLESTDISFFENHGTGTALGDPIEAGSVKAVYRRRDCPILVTTGKPNCGHLESASGVMALCKTLMDLLHMIDIPQIHLRQLSSHIDIAGWPHYFPTELADLGAPHRMVGMNGFGFGGTNSNAVLWARCRKGCSAPAQRVLQDRKTKCEPWGLLGGPAEVLEIADCVLEACPRCWGPMCWRCGAADPMGVGGGGGKGQHICTAIRKEFSSYDYCSDCYTGEYQYGGIAPSARGKAPDDQTVFIMGSWDNWSGLVEMRRLPDGDYVGEVRLGDCGFEHFQLVVGEADQQIIVPVVSNAAPGARVVGPVQAGRPQCWMIDGRADGASPGTVYEVRFRWQDRSKSVSWRRLGRRLRHATYDPTWAIVGSFNGWKPEEMHRSIAQPGAWEFVGRVGTEGFDKLHFMRSGDPTQRVYPLREVGDDETMPVMGPGLGDSEKGWEVTGNPHSYFQARLWAQDAAIFVELKVEPRPAVVFRSLPDTARDTYQLVGSFCEWRLARAREFTSPDPARPGLFTATFDIGQACREEFQIIVNWNVSQVYHPVVAGQPGRSFAAGPEPSTTALHWEVSGLPGQAVEVIFDHGAEDNLRMVTCKVGALMLQ